ncbi:unnamed protein product [Dovyalis caffra]|uniref:Glutamate receptor n=1 Tax=Dovyalis caffra TaxID=77055 RepID=A0AAV1SMC3_9ROSI|nr:unnamed protein product [Dovyalis caffra]
MAIAQNTTFIPVNVGVVLDLDDLGGKIGLSCINMAISDFYATHGHYKTRLLLTTRDSKKDIVGAASAALDLIENVEVQAIIGPTTSTQANFVIGLGEKAQVPIISFSASSPSLTSIRSSYFFRATQNDSSQVKSICALVQAFGWREAVPIYVEDDCGEGIIPYLTDALQEVDARVPYRSVISPSATNDQIVEELYKLMTMQTRVFIVHMFPSLGARLFVKAKEIGMMSEGYVWIMTDWLTAALSSSPDPVVIDAMQGVLGVKPYVPKTMELGNFRFRWKRKFQQDNSDMVDAEFNIYEPQAYDATIALAMAIEKAGTANLGFRKANVSNNSSTDLENFGVSQNGPSLLRELSKTSFEGLTGDFRFINGQLQSLAFQIVNMNENGARGIGFWTSRNGLGRNLNKRKTNTSTYSTSKSSLATIIWAGDSTSIPKGWEIPTNGKKLQIGVPSNGFDGFVKVTRDNSSNMTTVTGYSIAIFDAVVEELPYAMTYEYIPFAKPNGKSAGTYNDLVYQVYLKKYDAVVGDTTITANRSRYVDFTLPYTESGVWMIVPIKDERNKNAWERVVSNLARIVVTIWCFVVLILTQSYTASLSSMLTVQQLQPSVSSVNELIQKGEFVGYLENSFVLGILKHLGFDESKLMVYSSLEECDELFSKGSGNGGIAAAFDEVPYMKLLLSKYCSKYTMVEPTFKTGGFGFVFPKGSPLVADVSRAVLNFTEGDKMKEIEDAWFGKKSRCLDSDTSVSSNSLSLKSFWGLFLITGVASFLALMIFIAIFVNEHRTVLLQPSDSEASTWTRILDLFRIFIQKDLKSHAFCSYRSEPNPNHIANPGDPPPADNGDDPNPNAQPPDQEEVRNFDQPIIPNQDRPAAIESEPNPNHIAIPGDPPPADPGDDRNPNAEPPDRQEVQNVDQPIIPNQDRPAAIEINHENNWLSL